MIARKLFRLGFANPVSALYLGLVGAGAVFEVAVAIIEGPQEMGGLWVMLLTAPVSIALTEGVEMVGGGLSDIVLTVVFAVSAVIQSLALGLLREGLRGIRGESRHPRLG
ncbi:SCO4225 family membrane protein [Streptomyces sp. NPDC002308]